MNLLELPNNSQTILWGQASHILDPQFPLLLLRILQFCSHFIICYWLCTKAHHFLARPY